MASFCNKRIVMPLKGAVISTRLLDGGTPAKVLFATGAVRAVRPAVVGKRFDQVVVLHMR